MLIDKEYKKLENYWRKTIKYRRISEKIVLKASMQFGKDDTSHFINDFFSRFLLLVYMFAYAIFNWCQIHLCRITLMRILSLQKKEIAVDINELLANKENIKCYADDFVYSVITSKQYLKNIEVIFGNAHLEALDSIECFEKLTQVCGLTYYRGKVFSSLSEIRLKCK